VRLLADTHVVLWLLSDPGRLDPSAAEALRSPQNEVLVSVASLWEIAIKFAAGKLRLPAAPAEWLHGELAKASLDLLDIDARHALTAGALPPHHQDPFDRMLVAQALVESLTLVTRDNRLAAYGAAVMLA
jgi:PIN domain nuclease of toxin-antitoxin system